jgi:hypothetical protein
MEVKERGLSDSSTLRFSGGINVATRLRDLNPGPSKYKSDSLIFYREVYLRVTSTYLEGVYIHRVIHLSAFASLTEQTHSS